MAYIIAEPCIDVKDRACVDVCPVDCIYEPEATNLPEGERLNKLYIHPEECIDCGACEPECPVEAIFAEEDTPEQWKHYIQVEIDAFK
jgi:NAD-dependent dihydropyrimidine dehydrogenase PreA subunit